MIVIQHIHTGERMMYPAHNIHVNLDPVLLQQRIPLEFVLAVDQTPVPVIHPEFNTVNWTATDKDPIKTIEERWLFKNGY